MAKPPETTREAEAKGRSQAQIAMSYAPGQHFTFEGAAGACQAMPSPNATPARLAQTTKTQIEMRIDEAARAEALRNAGALLTFNTSKELRSGEAELLDGARLIQFIIAGVDFIPLSELPEGVPVATNGGGYAESMAEHALAMALAAAKRLILEHENLKRGQFNQFTRNRMLAGGVCGIFGFGGIGAATARQGRRQSPMSARGQSRLGGASCRFSHVRNAPLATVGPKKAACRDGPKPDSCTAKKASRKPSPFSGPFPRTCPTSRLARSLN